MISKCNIEKGKKMSKILAYSSTDKVDWHKANIKAAIQVKGASSCAELARRNQVNPYDFYNVFYKPYPKIEKIISAFLEIPPEDIWPSRYLHKC